MEHNVQQELEQVAAIYSLVTEFFVNYSFQLLGAFIIFLLGLWVASKISRWVFALTQHHQLDVTLSRFIASFARIIVIAMVAIVALNKLGISVTPLLAMIGAIGLGAGLAVQGLLSNYSAGMTIILTRPFVVNDTISVKNVTGQVKEVHLAFTLLTNEDGVQISIPNKHIIGEIIHNSGAHSLAEIQLGIAYSANPELAITTIHEALTTFNTIAQTPKAQVGIEGFGASSIDLGLRLWLPTDSYYQLLYKINLAVFTALKEKGIEIPFPQQEVRLLNSNN